MPAALRLAFFLFFGVNSVSAQAIITVPGRNESIDLQIGPVGIGCPFVSTQFFGPMAGVPDSDPTLPICRLISCPERNPVFEVSMIVFGPPSGPPLPPIDSAHLVLISLPTGMPTPLTSLGIPGSGIQGCALTVDLPSLIAVPCFNTRVSGPPDGLQYGIRYRLEIGQAFGTTGPDWYIPFGASFNIQFGTFYPQLSDAVLTDAYGVTRTR